MVRFPCWGYRETENRKTSRSFILLEVIKSVGLNFLPAVPTDDQKKRKKQFFLVSRQVLSLKRSRKTKSRFNSPVCSWDFRLAASVYTPRDSQQQLSGAMQFYHFPNHVSCQILSEKRLKCLLLSKWFFRCIPSLFL